MQIRLATRGSALARAQTSLVADALVTAGFAHGIEVDTITVPVSTTGDTTPGSLVGLSEVGVFVTAVREAVLDGDADIAVHSLKDMPVDPHPQLIVAVLEREDARDVLCCAEGDWESLPAGAVVGTSSPRRAAQVMALRNDLVVRDIRGNVDSRLEKLGNGYDAVVLAAAGLKRLGLAERVSHVFSVDDMVPAPGQGALAVEVRADADPQLVELVRSMDDAPARAAVTAERAVLAAVMAGCSTPVAAYATVDGGMLRLTARVVRPDGVLALNEHVSGPVKEALSLGRSTGHALLGRGASRLMSETS